MLSTIVQKDNTAHAENHSNAIATTPRQHLKKNIAVNSGVVKQQYIMAEPLEPCHVPCLQHTVQVGVTLNFLNSSFTKFN